MQHGESVSSNCSALLAVCRNDDSDSRRGLDARCSGKHQSWPRVRENCQRHPLRISISKVGELKDETDLLIDQIRTISNRRLMGDKPLAVLSRVHMKRVEDALRVLTGD